MLVGLASNQPPVSRPEDFKRKGSTEKIKDVVGSKYGQVRGAYVTGDEIIGTRALVKRRWDHSNPN